MFNTALLGVAIGGATLAAAAAYSFLTGEETTTDVDFNGDGETDMSATFNAEDEPTPDMTAKEAGEDADTTVESLEGCETLEDIKGVGPQRAEDLTDAGLTTPADVYYAADSTLLDVNGFGPRAVDMVRGDIGSVEGESSGNSNDSEASDAADEPSGGTDEKSSPSDEDGPSSDDGEQTADETDAGDGK